MMVWLLILLSFLRAQDPRIPDPGQRISAPKDHSTETPPFTLAVIRRDGIVSPFAVFDGKRWVKPWPTELDGDQRSRVKLGIPREWWGKPGPLTEMTAWLEGTKRGTIHVTHPVLLRLVCEWRMALASDYRSDEIPPAAMVQPFPKDGLAVSGPQSVDRIEIVSAESPEWKPTAALVKSEFDRAEEAAIKRYTDWKNPISSAVRRTTPVELEAMYRAPMDEDGWVAYYIEGVKKYAPGPQDDGCGLVASAGGWMFVAPDGKRFITLHGDVTYCDRRGVTFMLPLGLIKVQGKSYWTFQLSGYGREGYMVVRPTPHRAETMIQYSAAFCPQS